MGTKAHKTRKLALTRGLSGLIYPLDTESLPDRHGGRNKFARVSLQAGDTAREKVVVGRQGTEVRKHWPTREK